MMKAVEGVSVSTPALMSSLHSDDVFGIDTDSAKALSTDPKAFAYVDQSQQARKSVTMHSMGGGQGVTKGIGLMIMPAAL